MSILVKVYYSLLVDISRLTGVQLDLPADIDVSWVLNEGPVLDKSVLMYLEGNGETPTFPDWLKPLWDAFIINNNDAGILKLLRTVLVFGYKAEFEPTNEQLNKAVTSFVDANRDVGAWNSFFDKNVVQAPIYREARRLVGLVIGRVDYSKLLPFHGPGAVFPSHSPCFKGRFDICTPIVEYYPYDTHFNCVHESGHSDLVSPDYRTYDSIVCKLVAVPKDSRGPRLICVHPKEAVWIQQGQRTLLERAISHHSLTSGKINFTDQSINGGIALSSSSSREYCTLDLKEASDRIGHSLFKYLFGYHAQVLSCSRASHVRLLDSRLEELQMFAPMGNALTFPVESLIFWSLVRAGILCRHGQHCDDVYVFGDDIIFPSKYYDGAIYGLINAGLIPNVGKTFRKGFFRESCGVDAYNGKDVTPYRCKVRGISSYSDAESVCDLAKRLRLGGFIDTSSYLYSAVSNRFGRLSLTNNPDCQGLVEYCQYDFGTILRYEPRAVFNSSLHRWEVPYRKRVRTLEVLTHHAWWHVQDSLLSLERLALGYRTSEWDSIPIGDPDRYSERGLEYPTPRGERLFRGYSYLMLY
jgi:hypothetical protein